RFAAGHAQGDVGLVELQLRPRAEVAHQRRHQAVVGDLGFGVLLATAGQGGAGQDQGQQQRDAVLHGRLLECAMAPSIAIAVRPPNPGAYDGPSDAAMLVDPQASPPTLPDSHEPEESMMKALLCKAFGPASSLA